MLLHMFWVFVCFFAVIGLLECLLGLLDLFAFRRLTAAKSAVLRVELKGEVVNVEYLLNTLCLKAEKADLGAVETGLEIIDGGLAPETRQQILAYCEKNPWVIFTEHPDCDTI